MTHKLLVILYCLSVVTDTALLRLGGVAFGKSWRQFSIELWLSRRGLVTKTRLVFRQKALWQNLQESRYNVVFYRHFTKEVKWQHFCGQEGLAEDVWESHAVYVRVYTHPKRELEKHSLDCNMAVVGAVLQIHYDSFFYNYLVVVNLWFSGVLNASLTK